MPKEFNRHDNIDYEVIEVNKDTLLLRMRDCASYASLPSETVGYAGISLTLLSSAFLSETMRGIWVISGATVHAAFLVGGVVAALATVYKAMRWYQVRDAHSPENTVDLLLPNKRPFIAGLLPSPAEEAAVQQPRIRKTRTARQIAKESRV